MELLEIVKTALRIKSDTFDETEILPLIEACKSDLRVGGVNKIEDADPLFQRAAILYAKSHFGFHEHSEKFEKSYELLKQSMAMCGDYMGVV